MSQLIYKGFKLMLLRNLAILSILLLLCRLSVVGQNNIIDYLHSEKALFFNPALNNPGEKFEISIFPVVNTDFELSLPISLNDIFRKQQGSSLYELNIGRLGERAGRVNQSMLNSTIGFFSITGRWHSANWGFQVYDNAIAAFSFEKKLIELVNMGNSAFVNQVFSTRMPLSFRHFSTWQVSFSNEKNEKLNYGISAKLYFGKSAITSKTDLSLFTNENIEFVDIGLAGKVQAAGPIESKTNYKGFVNGIALMPDASLAQYLFEFKNPGLGVDLGIDYRFNERLKFLASIIDLGFICWLSNINSVIIDGSYRWDGFDISRLVNYQTDKAVIDDIQNINFADSILYSALTPTNQSYITVAPLKVYVAADYQYNNKLSFSAINRLILLDGFLRESFLLSGSYLISDRLELNSGFYLTNRSYFNIPFGITFKNAKIKILLSTSNVWSVFLPSYSRNFGGSLGVKFLFGGFSKDEREKMKNLPFFRLYPKGLEEE
jgi:hypothetical protein